MPNLTSSRKTKKIPFGLRNDWKRDTHSFSTEVTQTHRAEKPQLTCHRYRTLAQTGGRSVGSPCKHLQPGKQKAFSETDIHYAKQFQHLKSKGPQYTMALTLDPNQLMAYWQARDVPFYNLTMHSGLIHSDQANKYVHKKNRKGITTTQTENFLLNRFC